MTARAPRGAILTAGPRVRRWLLFSHLVTAGAWIGIDVVLACFVVVALGADDLATRAMAYQALEVFVVWPLLITSLLCLISGLLLGLTSPYGLLRFWWVVIKLALNVVLSTLVLVLLRPGVIDMAVAGRALLRGETADTGFVDTLMYPPIVSGTLLLAASAIAVFKPWGRTRWSVGRP